MTTLRRRSDRPTTEQKRHWDRVAALGCLVCERPAQISHCHGPDLLERDVRFLKPKGKKMRWMHWLVIPLCSDHHWAADNDPRHFALYCGSPARLLDRVAEATGVDVWAMARAELKGPGELSGA